MDEWNMVAPQEGSSTSEMTLVEKDLLCSWGTLKSFSLELALTKEGTDRTGAAKRHSQCGLSL